MASHRLGPEFTQNQKGVAKPWAGRKKNARAQRLADYIDDLKKRFNLVTGDPVEILIYVAAVGLDPMRDEIVKREKARAEYKGETYVEDDTRFLVDLELRLDAAKAAAPFVRPKLQATQITGAEDGPVEFKAVSEATKRLMENEKTRGMIEEILAGAAQADQVESSEGFEQ
jgi:hypothetical protein